MLLRRHRGRLRRTLWSPLSSCNRTSRSQTRREVPLAAAARSPTVWAAPRRSTGTATHNNTSLCKLSSYFIRKVYYEFIFLLIIIYALCIIVSRQFYLIVAIIWQKKLFSSTLSYKIINILLGNIYKSLKLLKITIKLPKFGINRFLQKL